jgi:hypothetical protein
MARSPSVDVQDIGGAAIGVANPLPVRLSDGAAYYTAGGGVGGGDPTANAAPLGAIPAKVDVVGGSDYGGTPAVRTLKVNASGQIEVSNFPASQAVTGTFWQTTQPVSIAASVAVTGPLTDTQIRATPLPVSGTVSVGNFPATQPVSLATNTPDVTDRAARLLGHVTVDNASLAVTGTFFQATQPVSLATNTPDVTDRAARLLGRARLTDDTNLSTIKAASTLAAATDTALVVQHSPHRADASTLAITATGAAAASVTATLPAPAAGLFHYITSIQIVKFATALLTAAAAPVVVTTTNLPGSLAFSFSAAASAQGTNEVQTLFPFDAVEVERGSDRDHHRRPRDDRDHLAYHRHLLHRTVTRS